jgi:curved DNA-binding protein CbpA
MKDYYKVLGIPRNASSAQIRQAYRDLVKQCHPDINPSQKAAEWTRELNEAYAILSDMNAKASHDMDLKLDESGEREVGTKQTTKSQPRNENGSTPRPEPNFCCEKCRRADSSLRVSGIWRVTSGFIVARKSPTVKILCNRCRVKETLAASTYKVG